MKIALFIPYFGKLPSYMPLFLKFFKINFIDIFFISDLDFSELEIPENVHIIKVSFDELKERIHKVTGLIVNWTKPYKLCDLKPLYGLLFQNILQSKGYDYWAFGDCDLIYGNCLESKLVSILKDDYDIISFRKLWVTGSLCILKNAERVNRLFIDNCPEIKEVVQNDKNYAADECGLVHKQLLSGCLLNEIDNEITSFTEIIINCSIKWYHEDIIQDIIANDEIITVEGNNIISSKNNNPIFILHFVCNKYDPLFKFPNWKTIPYKFNIDKYGFYTKSTIIRSYYKLYRRFHKFLIMTYSKFRNKFYIMI